MKKICVLLLILSALFSFGRTTFVDVRSYDGIEVAVEYTAPDNLDTGIPTTNNVDKIIDRPGYACGYSNKYKQPLWVKYRLTRKEVDTSFGSVKRTDNFHSDKIVDNSATPGDYKRSGYDKGHLAPAADMSWSEDAMDDSFNMSNMSPQIPECNRGIWKDIETWTRNEALKHGSLVIVSGPIFRSDTSNVVIGNGVAVPSGYYKVIYNENPTNKSTIAFVVPNVATDLKFYQCICTLHSVEIFTSIQFFPKVNADDLKCDEVVWESWTFPGSFTKFDRYIYLEPAIILFRGAME